MPSTSSLVDLAPAVEFEAPLPPLVAADRGHWIRTNFKNVYKRESDLCKTIFFLYLTLPQTPGL